MEEQIEKLDQEITLELQKIDENLEYCFRKITQEIIPRVRGYSNICDDIIDYSSYLTTIFRRTGGLNMHLQSVEDGSGVNVVQVKEQERPNSVPDSIFPYAAEHDKLGKRRYTSPPPRVTSSGFDESSKTSANLQVMDVTSTGKVLALPEFSDDEDDNNNNNNNTPKEIRTVYGFGGLGVGHQLKSVNGNQVGDGDGDENETTRSNTNANDSTLQRQSQKRKISLQLQRQFGSSSSAIPSPMPSQFKNAKVVGEHRGGDFGMPKSKARSRSSGDSDDDNDNHDGGGKVGKVSAPPPPPPQFALSSPASKLSPSPFPPSSSSSPLYSSPIRWQNDKRNDGDDIPEGKDASLDTDELLHLEDNATTGTATGNSPEKQ